MNRVKQKRIELGLTQEQLAKAAGLGGSNTVYRYESGDRTPDLPALLGLALATSLPVETILIDAIESQAKGEGNQAEKARAALANFRCRRKPRKAA